MHGLIADESGQGSAELILVFGGIIVIVTVAVVWYRNYVRGSLCQGISNSHELRCSECYKLDKGP